MLIQLTVSNYRSFRGIQTLNMMAGNLTELPNNTFAALASEDIRLLKAAVVYGPNASGKSNLIRAADFMRGMVTDSLESAEWLKVGGNLGDPFRLDHKSTSQPSAFEVVFMIDEVRYQYGFSVLGSSISNEWLRAYPNKVPQTWFERGPGSGDWSFSPHLKGEKKRLVDLTRPDALFLSVAAQFNHQQLTPIYLWFNDQVKIIESTPTSPEYTARRALEDQEFHKLVANALKIADLGIADFLVEPQPEPSGEATLFEVRKRSEGSSARFRRRGAIVKTLHHISNPEKAVEFDLVRDESLGTRRFFGLIGRWVDALRTASVVLVDELDASMHPALTRLLVTMFQDPRVNPRNAQAIVTTHDTTLLDNSVFRRDQVWFVQKDAENASHLYSLQDFHPRKDEALQKGYLAGRYGAMPFIGELNI